MTSLAVQFANRREAEYRAIAREILGDAKLHFNVKHFGAVGDGIVDDTLAVQAAAAQAGIRGGVVTGAIGDTYLINGQRAQWSTLDLHTAGKPAATPNFSDGYWYGVLVPSNVILDGLTVKMTRGASTTRASHAFAFGDPTSVTRGEGNEIRNCTFIADSSLDSNPGQRAVLAQSVDGFKWTGGTVLGWKTSGNRRAVGGYFFDCVDALVSGVTFDMVQLCLVFEFCNDVTVNASTFRECNDGLDFDKRCHRITVSDNIYDRADSSDSHDAFIEFNSTQGANVRGNICRRAYRYLISTIKPDVYTTWANVLAQSGSTSTDEWSEILLDGNTVIETYQWAVLTGNDWDSNPHVGTLPGHGLRITDTFQNCATSFSGGGDDSVIRIMEGTEIVLRPIITGGPAKGVWARAFVDADVTGASAYSALRIVEFAGVIRDTGGAAVHLTQPDYVRFSGLVVRDCANVALDRQVLVTRPETRSAFITGFLDIEATTVQVAHGLRVSSADFRTGGWLMDLSGARITGHDVNASARDFFLDNTSGDKSLELIKLRNCDIPRTNFQSAGATTLAATTVFEGWGTAAPTDVDRYFPVGAKVWNVAPSATEWVGWICVSAGAPGTWKGFGVIET